MSYPTYNTTMIGNSVNTGTTSTVTIPNNSSSGSLYWGLNGTSVNPGQVYTSNGTNGSWGNISLVESNLNGATLSVKGDDTKMDPLQFMLDQGLNPQFLAMEGTRILDEARHAAEAVSLVDEGTDVEFDLIDLSPAPVSSLPLIQQPVVIVDDDDQTLRTIAGGLSENGFVVHAVTRSEDALIKVDTLYRNGGRPTVLIDLIMPKMDGSGVMGGAELLELLHNNFKDLALIIMSDFHCAEAEKKIHQLGYPSIVKPLQVEISSPAIMDSFLAKLMHVIRTQA